MRRLSRAAVVVWSGILLGGCAAIAGLDQIQETECAPNCDAGTVDAIVDHTVDSPLQGDDSQPPQSDATQDTTGDDTGQPEASSDDSSTGHDSGMADGPTTDASDGGPDAPADAPFDSGCGPLDTTSNCSACGDKCAVSGTAASQTSTSCKGPVNGAGATCSYTCATGYLDCNASLNPPDLDGCECHSPGATPANCGSNGCCPVQHNNGLGMSNSTFYDCVVGGTYNSTLAKDACISYVGTANASECAQYNTMGCDDSGTYDLAWCSGMGGASDCICWFYSGPDTGKIYDSGSTTCYCPLPPLASYN